MNKYILSGIILMLGFCGYVLGVDLAEQVATRFQPDYDLGLADKYLQFPYTGNFLKDPFLNAMDVYEGMSAQARVAGVKYVERALTLKGCGLSNEKQWAILYYYVPEFRSEIARDLKMNGGDYGSENYIFDDNVMLDYCTEFYNCITKESGGEDDGDTKKITSGTPEDIKTNCKEFFQTNYREGQAEEKRVQNLQIAWLGNDKYVNATTDESPYDVMRDLGIIGELSYLKPQFPITPIFYDLPIFAKSKEALLNNKNGGGGDCVEETYGGIAPFEEEISLGGISKDLDKSPSLEKQVNNGGTSSITEKTVSLDKEFVVGNQGLEKQVSVGGNSNSVEKSVSLNGTQAVGQNVQVKDSVNNGVIGQNDAVLAGGQSNGSVKPLKSLTVEGYDDLLEGLGAYRLKEDKSAYYGSLCRDVEESAKEEVEPEAKFVEEETVTVTRDEIMPGEAPSLTKVEYKELVDYMTEAVNSYASLSEEKKKEIEQKAGDVSKYNGAATAEQTEAVAKKILGCYQSCEGLNVDGQFACMLKCSCGEITSPIFDPEINPGMGPIFMIRYCAVPAVNPRYYYEGSDGTDSWSSTLLKGVKSSIGGLFGNGSSGGGSNGGGTSGGGSSGGGNTGGGRSGGGGNGGGTSGGGNAGGGSCSGGGNGGSNEAIVPSFNVGGKTIVGMEEGINEIHGVVDKLAREGRLGIWTQQYNFFDSSTKLTDIADTFSFTMSAEKKSIKQKVGEPTEEYKKRVMKTRNYNWLVANHVANPIDNPATRNWYLLVGYEGEVVGDIVASANADMSRQSQGYLNVAPSFIVDQSENSNAARYAKISELFSDWLDEQGDFWAQKVDYLNELDSYAKALYAKKG